MFEGMLNIDIGENEVSKKILSCADRGKPFEAFGRSYLIESVSRNFNGVTGWIRAEMRELAKPEWRGRQDGLPPVGLDCAFGPTLHAVKIIAHAVDERRHVAIGQGVDDVFMGGAESFQRLMSPEEVEQQEREEGIRALHTIMDGPGYREAAERLYKAGVRAPEVE